MKRVIAVFLIASLISGCDRLTDIVSPASKFLNAPSLASKSPKVPAPKPSNTPVPTSSPKETAPVLPDNAASSSWISCYGYFPTINVNNLVLYWALNAVVYAVSVIALIVFSYALYRESTINQPTPAQPNPLPFVPPVQPVSPPPPAQPVNPPSPAQPAHQQPAEEEPQTQLIIWNFPSLNENSVPPTTLRDDANSLYYFSTVGTDESTLDKSYALLLNNKWTYYRKKKNSAQTTFTETPAEEQKQISDEPKTQDTMKKPRRKSLPHSKTIPESTKAKPRSGSLTAVPLSIGLNPLSSFTFT